MNNPLFGEFCWSELATSNPSAAKEFYSKMFGWQFIDSEVGDTTYTMIKIGDSTFGGIWQIPTEQKDKIPPHWMGYILVENIEQSIQKAEDLGATIKMAVSDVGDFGKMALIIDPTGAHIALWQNRQKCEDNLDKDLKDTFPASDATAQY